MLYHESKEFIENLNNWLTKHDDNSGRYLTTNRNKIPMLFRTYTQHLFRGISTDQATINSISSNNFKYLRATSWTKEERIAEKFLNDSRFITKHQGNIKIVLYKTIPPKDVILDIDKFVHFYGKNKLLTFGMDEINIELAMKLKEVLIAPIRILKNEYTLY